MRALSRVEEVDDNISNKILDKRSSAQKYITKEFIGNLKTYESIAATEASRGVVF